MRSAAWILRGCVAVFAALGLAFLVAPVDILAHIDVRAGSPSAVADLRAVYGGLELGVAATLALCGRASVRLGLSAALAIFLAMALARLVGFAVDGPQTWLSIALLAAEASGVAVVAVALRASDRDVA